MKVLTVETLFHPKADIHVYSPQVVPYACTCVYLCVYMYMCMLNNTILCKMNTMVHGWGFIQKGGGQRGNIPPPPNNMHGKL